MTSTERTTADTIRASIDTIRNTPQDDTIDQRCSLDVDADGTLTLSTQHPDVNGISMAIYNGVTLSFGLPSGVDPVALADFLTDSLVDVQTLVDGMDSDWDGSNMVGTLSDEAQAVADMWDRAAFDMTGFMGLPGVQEMNASDFFWDVTDQIAAQPDAAAAVAFCRDCLTDSYTYILDTGTIHIDPNDLESYATGVWESAHEINTD